MKVIKWAGSKYKLLPTLLEYLPENYNNYIEPFLGSGAMLFRIKPSQAIVSDINCELINMYQVIKDRVGDLITYLSIMRNTKEYFYAVREWDVELTNEVMRASRFIYLNKTCFNGLYRENSKGEFNVPYGYYKNPKICDDLKLRELSNYLNSNNIEILCQDYTHTLLRAQPNDFIYIDSPYNVVNKTSFTKYSKKDFKEEDQIRLAKEFKHLNELGCFLLLSNSDTELIREIYKDYEQIQITTNRSINSDGVGRKNTGLELLIKNY